MENTQNTRITTALKPPTHVVLAGVPMTVRTVNLQRDGAIRRVTVFGHGGKAFRLSAMSNAPKGLTHVHDVTIGVQFHVYATTDASLVKHMGAEMIHGPLGWVPAVKQGGNWFALRRTPEMDHEVAGRRTRPIQCAQELYQRIRALAEERHTTISSVTDEVLSRGLGASNS